jgi:hypothetical protein
MPFSCWPNLALLAWIFVSDPQTWRLTIPAGNAALFLLSRFISFWTRKQWGRWSRSLALLTGFGFRGQAKP